MAVKPYTLKRYVVHNPLCHCFTQGNWCCSLSRWPNGLASRRKFWTCVQLAFRLATHLRRLAPLTLDELKLTQADAGFLPFGHPAQVDTSWSHYKNALTNYMCEIYGFLRLANLRIRLWPPFANLYANSAFANLRWLASTCESFGQGILYKNHREQAQYI